jgi:DNA mismatch repair protein MSH6
MTASEKKKDRQDKFKDKNERRYEWLLDIRDEQGRRIGEPGYDPRTLYIPKSAWKEFTPFEKQFWEIKSQHWDKVVFFKKGKFYGGRFPSILLLNEDSLLRKRTL